MASIDRSIDEWMEWNGWDGMGCLGLGKGKTWGRVNRIPFCLFFCFSYLLFGMMKRLRFWLVGWLVGWVDVNLDLDWDWDRNFESGLN